LAVLNTNKNDRRRHLQKRQGLRRAVSSARVLTLPEAGLTRAEQELGSFNFASSRSADSILREWRFALKFQRPTDGFADLFHNGHIKFSPSIRQLVMFDRADGLHVGEGLKFRAFT
jgi:hypothetical protein